MVQAGHSAKNGIKMLEFVVAYEYVYRKPKPKKVYCLKKLEIYVDLF